MGCPYLWAGWRLSPTPLKNDGVKVSWDDEIPFPTEWKVIKAMFQTFPNHQPDGGVPKIVWVDHLAIRLEQLLDGFNPN